MRHLMRLAAGALLLAGASAGMAQDAPDGPPPRGIRSETRANALERAQALFTRADADHDGFVTPQEIASMAQRRRADGPPPPGMVPPPAPKGNAAPPLPHDDAARGPRGSSMAMRLFAAADADHDGRISAAEAQATAGQQFDAADADHDGTVTPDERRAAIGAELKALRN